MPNEPVRRVPGAGYQQVSEPSATWRVNDTTTDSGRHKIAISPRGTKPTGPTLRRKLLEDPRTPEAIDRILYQATDPEFGAWKPDLQQKAAFWIGDQAIGTARQTIDVSDDTGVTILDILKQRAQQLGYIPQAPPALPPAVGEVDIPPPARKRGRPKGSTDKTQRKRRQA